MTDCDVVVIGCGGAGSAAAAELARRGHHVIGVEQFAALHDRGSSHGSERIVRTAYTDPMYAKLAAESIESWKSLERSTGEQLLTMCGGIDFGFPDELRAIEASCASAGMPTEWIEPLEATRRFPGFRFEDPVLFQPESGTVHADRAVAMFHRLAIAAGAELRFDTPVIRIMNDGNEAVVVTASGTIRTRTVVFAGGAWADRLLDGLLDGFDAGRTRRELLPELTVTNEQVFFFRPVSDFAWPTFIRRRIPEYYGLPTPDGLLKAGGHYTGAPIDPDRRGEPDPQARRAVSEWMRENVPGVDPDPVRSTTCLYATYPDEDFIIDRVGNVVMATGLGGHGFKFLPEIGRRVADLVDGVETADNPFAFDRVARSVGPSGHK